MCVSQIQNLLLVFFVFFYSKQMNERYRKKTTNEGNMRRKRKNSPNLVVYLKLIIKCKKQQLKKWKIKMKRIQICFNLNSNQHKLT